MRSIVRLCLAGVLVAGPIAGAQVHGTEDHSAAARQAPLPAKAVQTRAALRDLWVGHVFWVRNVAVATLAKNDAAAKAAEEAAVANAKAIAAEARARVDEARARIADADDALAELEKELRALDGN